MDMGRKRFARLIVGQPKAEIAAASGSELGNLAFTTVKSSTYRKNVGGNAPSPHALAGLLTTR